MDVYYWGYVISGLAVLLFFIIALIAQGKVMFAHEKYSKVKSEFDLTGEGLAKKLSLESGVDVKIRSIKGNLTDNYDPTTKTLNISAANFSGKSIAAHAVVAHEFGHALQHAKGYLPLKVRHFAIKLSQFASGAFLPLLIVGILLEIFLFNPFIGNVFIYCVAGFFGLSCLVNLVTIPVEYNASRRAKKLLQENAFYTKEEMKGVNEVLDAAALTYVAALLISLAYFARLLLIILGNRR